MPRLTGKVEGRGNGIKTAIVNIKDVSTSLHRSPEEITKFFGFELGAQTIWNEEIDRSIVNGAHTDRVLQDLIHKYIDIFVLCPKCSLPESQYKIKSGIIYHNCMACGGRELVDMSHKLSTFITNKHKKEKKELAKSKNKKEKKSKVGDDSKEKKKSKKDKSKKTKKEGKSKESDTSKSEDDQTKSSLQDGDTITDDILSDDGDNEDVATTANLEVDDAGAFDNCVSSISRYIADGVSPEDLIEELRTAQTFSAFPIQYRIHLYVASAFQGKSSLAENDVKECGPVLKLLSKDIENQRHIIGAFELLCVRIPSLKPFFPVILKHLYDEDLVEEEVFLLWANQGFSEEFSPPGVSEEVVDDLIMRSKPFLTWLLEAEEDGSDED